MRPAAYSLVAAARARAPALAQPVARAWAFANSAATNAGAAETVAAAAAPSDGGGTGAVWHRMRGATWGGCPAGGGGHRYNLRLSPFLIFNEAFAWRVLEPGGGDAGREVMGIDVDRLLETVVEAL